MALNGDQSKQEAKQKERMNWVKYRQHVKKTRKRNKKIKKTTKKEHSQPWRADWGL